ncbi:MAG: LysR family transcriptional regulator [Fusobacterium sp.]|uniref:helix-turn-helix domain-containing protein n=1 Tax=Fusobacterium sp. TaxID=68766 RepID=UPI002A74E2EB|nr:LysR family transcriptional regulator [Fusobacterium sp.]MDY2981177.1 LysR family transcriptional regulator [Fusobacterium sp.]
MNIQYLKYVVEVDKMGSINKAAKNLYMGQPNLSAAIKELEKDLGISIFYRSKKGVFPTKEGRNF